MSAKKLEVIFVRHGQSTANMGEWNQPFAGIKLTEIGEQQSQELAAQWAFTPARILVSPFTRTMQTAEPTIRRFPQVPVEMWEVHEFTYWDIAHWQGDAAELKMEDVARYWRVADPEFRQGGAETFGEMLGRAAATLRRLEEIEAATPVIVFTHGHFIQALRHVVRFPQWNAEQKMQNFRSFDEENRVRNVQQIPASFDGERWEIG